MSPRGHKSLRGLRGMTRVRQEGLQRLGIRSAEQYAALMLHCPNLVVKMLGSAEKDFSEWHTSTFARIRRSREFLQARLSHALSRRRGLSDGQARAVREQDPRWIQRLAATYRQHRGLPPEVSLVERIVRIHDQGENPSCVGHAGAAAIEISAGEALSGIFLYLASKRHDGQAEARGTSNEALRVALEEEGVCRLETWPGVNREAEPIGTLDEPPESAFREALQYRVEEGEGGEVSTVQEIKTALAYGLDGSGLPVVMGMPIFDSSIAAALNGDFTMRLGEGDSLLGWHDVLIVGFRDDRSSPGGGRFIIQNSWGEEWAPGNPDRAGLGTVPYAYFSDYGCEAFVFAPRVSRATTPWGRVAKPLALAAVAIGLLCTAAFWLRIDHRPNDLPVAVNHAEAPISDGRGQGAEKTTVLAWQSGTLFPTGSLPAAKSTEELNHLVHALEADLLIYRARILTRAPELTVVLAPVRADIAK